jgi:hypothetical protein
VSSLVEKARAERVLGFFWVPHIFVLYGVRTLLSMISSLSLISSTRLVLNSMFSFESFVFTMLLVSSSEAGTTSLRSSVPDLFRRLSFQAIAGYEPQTLVTDHVSLNWCWVRVGLLALSPAG